MITRGMPMYSRTWRVERLVDEFSPRAVETSTIHTSEIGTRIFQPSVMNWSYLMRGSVPRSQTKTNMNTRILMKNQTRVIQPSFAPGIREIGHGARQPPRNSVVAIAETLIMLMYSARKNSPNRIDVYSVLNPPTSSPSASAMSNGARLVSPTIDTQ